MPFALEQLTQGLAILGKLDPVSQGTGTTQPIKDIDLSKIHRVLFIFDVGSVGGAGTVTLSIQESKTAGGTYQNLVSNPISLSVISTSNQIATIELRDDQLDAGYRYVQLVLVVAGNAVLVSAVCLGGEAELKPAKAQNISSGIAQQFVA
jgi:hypothetical protein